MRLYSVFAFIPVGVLSACSVVPEPTQQSLRASQPLAATAVAAVIPGYQHTLAQSRFRIGTPVAVDENDAHIERWRGPFGAFAVDPSNFAAMGIPDADAPVGPYGLSESAHNALVLAYFENAGIPANQIAGVHATSTMTGGGSASDPSSSMPTANVSFNTVLSRSINGIPVVDSVAWAKMNTNGDVDMETVFWPDIDATVAAGAAALAAQLADPTRVAHYKSTIGAASTDTGGVAIRHSTYTVHQPVTCYVSYDVVLAGSALPRTTRHFDVNGVEFRLPQEMVSVPSTPKAGRP